MFAQGIPVAVFEVTDIAVEFARLRERGAVFLRQPAQAGPVTLALFADTCGNLIQLYQPA
jgi:predicted enzyme related to lactoylglutathione lyase